MKNIWKNNKKYKIIIIIILLVIIIIGVYIENFNKENKVIGPKSITNNEDKKDLNNRDIYEYAKKYIEENKYNITKYFKDRVGIIKNNDILIGTNNKELDNGYYDICISLEDNRIDIQMLKLWKDNNSKELYDEYYIKEVSRCILDICKKDYTEGEISKLEEYILSSYLESKKDSPIINNIEIGNIKILSNIKDGVLVMGIY